MASLMAWLDTSAEEQRRVRDILDIFTQTESRDELGIGQVRDAISDTLFPGTSVIQTRARYFLFVPWLYREGARRRSGGELKAWTDRQERQLVEALRKAGDTEGLFGKRAGPAVKILPSSIYWSGLARYGILQRDLAPNQLGRTDRESRVEADELVSRQSSDWSPTLPPMPEGFPGRVDGFDLTYEEASWLKEHVLTAAEGTLLAHLLGCSLPPDRDSWAPWDDRAGRTAQGEIAKHIQHAKLFSLGMHGAALLYNLLVGERYELRELTRVPHPVYTYRQRLTEWGERCQETATQFARWDRDDFWTLVQSSNPRVRPQTRRFVDAWMEAIISGNVGSAADDAQLRHLIGNRERMTKGAQSRLINDRLLRTWSGEAGSGALVFRWPQVRRLVTEIHEGMGRHVIP